MSIETAGHPPGPQPLIDTLQQSAAAPVYALLDAARDAEILPLLRTFGVEPVALLRGTKADDLADYGAQLASLDRQPALLDHLVQRGWGRSWGIYLTSPAPIAELAEHLRGHCWTQAPDGRHLYFRFYDPRVLRTALPAMSPADLDAFLGPVTALHMEAADPAELEAWQRAGPKISHRRLSISIPDRPAAPLPPTPLGAL
jgi:hypothetical protein